MFLFDLLLGIDVLHSGVRSLCFAVGSHLLQNMRPSDKNRQVSERHDCIYLPSLRDLAQGLHMIVRLTDRKENNSSLLTSLNT